MIGKVLKGIYRVYDKVGTGGFATVYLGRNLQTNEIVAIKVLREEYTQEPRFVKRFRREAHLAQSLQHPKIVRVLDYGVEDGQHFLVMDYVEGKTVAQIIHERGPLPLDQALSIVIQTCQALDHASRAGIVHRDIKPQNLMVTPDGMVKVMDLGIAKGAALATMTQSGHFMGTPRYISPEMAKGQKTDIRSDLYSLGIVLYEMLTGRAPFEAESPWAVLRDQIETVPRPLTAFRRGLPAWLETVVAKTLAKEPADRFQTPAEMLVALQAKRRVVTPATATPPPEAPTIAGPAVRVVTPAPERRLSPLLLAVLVAALALVVVMGGVGIASMIKSRSAGSVVSATKPAQTVLAGVPTFTPRSPLHTPTTVPPTSTSVPPTATPIPPSPTPTYPPGPVTLNWDLGWEPETLDPALAADSTSIDLVGQLFLGLTNFDENGNVLPELATDWEISDDALTWTFHMRRDVRWSDGQPVIAPDVEYGVKRSLDPRTESDYAYVLYIIEGAEELNTADETTDALIDSVGVEAIDDYTVRFDLTEPAGYFPAIVGMWVANAQPRSVIEAHGERWIEPGFIVTNGPYLLKEWVHEDHIVLEKNLAFYDADEVQIERIEAVMIAERSTALAMYENNELDWVQPPLQEMDRIKVDPALSKELVIAPRDCMYYYGFTTNKPPVNDPLVRKALSAGIDRQGLIDYVTKGNQLPANAFAPSMVFGNVAGDSDIAPWALDYELGKRKAKEWLAEAGYPNGEGFPTITLMHNTSETHQKIAQAIAAMWSDVLNIDVSVENQEWKVYLKTIQEETPLEDTPHVWRLGWCSDYPDENSWVHGVFNAEEGAKRVRWHNSEFDRVTEEARVETDPTVRRALYHRAEKILVEEQAAMAPIYYYTYVYLEKPWLTGTYASYAGGRIREWRIDWAAKAAASKESFGE